VHVYVKRSEGVVGSGWYVCTCMHVWMQWGKVDGMVLVVAYMHQPCNRFIADSSYICELAFLDTEVLGRGPKTTCQVCRGLSGSVSDGSTAPIVKLKRACASVSALATIASAFSWLAGRFPRALGLAW
jgi:hypothetical protein